MTNWIVISVIAGLAAAAMSASIIAPSLISFLLFYLAPIPLFMAGLGWGPTAAALAGIVGTIVTAAVLGTTPAVFFALSNTLAPVLLSRLALISRPADNSGSSEGEASNSGTEWYPEGRLVLWCAALAIGLAIAGVLAVGPDAESFQNALSKQVTAAVEQIQKQMPEVDEAQFKDVAAAFVTLLPPAMSAIWMLTTLFNMWIASRLLRVGDHSLRPWAPFHRLTYPRSSLAALAICMVLAFMPGLIGIIGTIAAAVFLVAFTVLGLAVVHGLTLNSPARFFLLVTTYMLLTVMGGILVLPLCGLAVADMFLGLRQRAAGAPANDND